jgi:transposase
MRRAVPAIAESAADLKQHLQRERDGRKKPRRQMLYLLASAQARTRQEAATLLGVSRNTLGRWLALYQTGGMAALLTVYVPPGKRPSLAPEVLLSIEQRLQQPTGFSSYEELRQWVEQTHQVRVKSQNALHARPQALQGQAQGSATKPHTQRLRRVPNSRPAVLSTCAQPSHLTPRAQVTCSAKTKVAVAC